MIEEEKLDSLLKEKFGKDLLNKTKDFPNNIVNIIDIKENPIDIKTIVLENEREYHLNISEETKQIYHDCPSFLIYSEPSKKICVHLVKVLLIIEKVLTLKILEEFESYSLTSEDYNSKKKSLNYQILANRCFEDLNLVEGLNFLNKAILSQYECGDIVEKYFTIAIENNLFLEFFEFLKTACESELLEIVLQHKSLINRGLNAFRGNISKYSFFNLLKIINFIEKTPILKDLADIPSFYTILEIFAKNANFNENYFAFYFLRRYRRTFESLEIKFTENLEKFLMQFEPKIIEQFYFEITQLSLIDKLKLLKGQLKVLEVKDRGYLERYKGYKEEIKELERKVYLKKFSFLKYLMEKYKIKRTKIHFKKQRNVYIVNHDKDNLHNPAYKYILSHIGFYGTKELNTIKSNDLGLNYFFMKDLFLDDFKNYPDIFYYKTQFWGDLEIEELNSIDGFSLISTYSDFDYDINTIDSHASDIFIIEWDLAKKPRFGSIVNAYDSQIVIPDYNNPLFYDLKPFDLCYCYKNPVRIEGSIIKTVNVISKCSFKDVVKIVANGMNFIQGYYPISLAQAVVNQEINPFEADNIVVNDPNKYYVPNFERFIKAFREFLYDYIADHRNEVFAKLKDIAELNEQQVISLLNITNELRGISIPLNRAFNELYSKEITLKQFKKSVLAYLHKLIQEILTEKRRGSTYPFDVKKMKETQFQKYINDIVTVRKIEFETTNIPKYDRFLDLTEIGSTYYGKQLLKLINVEELTRVSTEKFRKFEEYAKKLNLKIKVV